MRKIGLFSLASALVVSFAGCGAEPTTGNLKVGAPITEQQSAEKAKEVMKGMGGQYKGAPGAPKPKG